MATHLLTVLCTKASVDQSSNNLSLFDIVEELSITVADKVPSAKDKVLIPVTMDVVVVTFRSDPSKPEMARGRLLLLMPDKTKTLGAEFEIKLVDHQRMRNIVHMSALPVNEPGIYYFVVEFSQQGSNEWSEVYRLPVNIKLEAAKQPTAKH